MNFDVYTLKKGIELSKHNSESLYRAAELLSGEKIYGTASSILILSAEEIIKSYSLVLEMVFGNQSEVKRIIKDSKIKGDNSYLYNHVEKHNLAKALIEQLTSISPILNIIKHFLPKKLQEITVFFTLPIGQYDKILLLLSDFESLNTIKNSGLYVDQKNGDWLTPLSFTKSEYMNLREKIMLLFEIFSPKIDYILQMPEDYLKSLNDLHSPFVKMNSAKS